MFILVINILFFVILYLLFGRLVAFLFSLEGEHNINNAIPEKIIPKNMTAHQVFNVIVVFFWSIFLAFSICYFIFKILQTCFTTAKTTAKDTFLIIKHLLTPNK